MEENKNQENLNDENSFKSVAPNAINNQAFNEKKAKNDNGTGFVKTVLLPFTCGVLRSWYCRRNLLWSTKH